MHRPLFTHCSSSPSPQFHCPNNSPTLFNHCISTLHPSPTSSTHAYRSPLTIHPLPHSTPTVHPVPTSSTLTLHPSSTLSIHIDTRNKNKIKINLSLVPTVLISGNVSTHSGLERKKIIGAKTYQCNTCTDYNKLDTRTWALLIHI